MEQLELITPAMELKAAKESPDGAWLSPAAQALYEEEGRARFAARHRRIAGWVLSTANSGITKEGAA
jgi:hypothetical protein